jgi:hypothetical protein
MWKRTSKILFVLMTLNRVYNDKVLLLIVREKREEKEEKNKL